MTLRSSMVMDIFVADRTTTWPLNAAHGLTGGRIEAPNTAK